MKEKFAKELTKYPKVAEMDEEEIDEFLFYLDELRESGVINMFGAVPYIAVNFKYDDMTAKECLLFWMDTFSKRHK